MKRAGLSFATALGLLLTGIAPAVLGLLLVASVAGAAEHTGGAVEEHKGTLDAAVVVWCIQHPEAFKVAAHACDIDVGTEQEADVLTRNGHRIDLLTWAQLKDPQARRDFETACNTALAAFSRSAVDVALGALRRGVIGPRVLHDVIETHDGNSGILGISTDIHR